VSPSVEEESLSVMASRFMSKRKRGWPRRLSAAERNANWRLKQAIKRSGKRRVPSARDLDAVMEEQRIKEATAGHA